MLHVEARMSIVTLIVAVSFRALGIEQTDQISLAVGKPLDLCKGKTIPVTGHGGP
jgi:hypothetical protein